MSETQYIETKVFYNQAKNQLAKKMYEYKEPLVCYTFDRSGINLITDEENLNQCSLYIIESSITNEIYIGKTDRGINRLFEHDKFKEFWDHGYIFTRNDFNLLDISYLEYFFINRFTVLGRKLNNKTVVKRPQLSEVEEVALNKIAKKIMFFYEINQVNRLNFDLNGTEVGEGTPSERLSDMYFDINNIKVREFHELIVNYSRKSNLGAFDNSLIHDRNWLVSSKYSVKGKYDLGVSLPAHRNNSLQLYIYLINDIDSEGFDRLMSIQDELSNIMKEDELKTLNKNKSKSFRFFYDDCKFKCKEDMAEFIIKKIELLDKFMKKTEL